MLLRILPLVLLFGCSVSKNKEIEESVTVTSITLLHDIWALKTIQNEPLPDNLMKAPVLEIYVEEKRVSGNDGCNSVSGGIKVLTEKEMQFGQLISTKMACPNMEFSSKFNGLLLQTRQYKLEKMFLVLMDEQGKELLRFQKVD